MSMTKSQLVRQINLPDAQDIAISPSGKSAVVCQPSSSKISIIDTSSGEILKSISFHKPPTDVAFSRNGIFLYVVLAGDSIVVFFASDWQEVKRFPWTTIDTKLVAGDKDGRAYVVSRKGLDELDLAKSEIVRSLAISEPEKSLALSSDNLHLCAVTPKSLIVIDVLGWNKKFELPIDSGWVVSLDPVGKCAFVGQNGDRNVEVFDFVSGRYLESIPGNSHVKDIAFNPSGSLAFILSSTPANMAVYSVGVEIEKIEDISIGGYPESVVVTPDGNHVYVSNGSAVKVFEVSWRKM